MRSSFVISTDDGGHTWTEDSYLLRWPGALDRVAVLGDPLRPPETDDEPWPPYPQPRPDHRWLLVLAVVVLLGIALWRTRS